MRWNMPSPLMPGLVSWCKEKAIPLSVQSLACLAVAWIVAQSFWWRAAPDSPAVIAKASSTLSEQVNRVTARHFFEVATERPPSSEVGESPPPNTIDARWRLMGTYVVPGAHSRAVLATDGGFDVVVAKVGDRLSSGHEVVEVRPDSVVLSKDALRGELPLRSSAPGGPDREPPQDQSRPAGPPPFIKDFR
ncbi:type II secretion system protein N [Variovorax sp. AFSI2.2]|uniref:type II secretion system protein N n=1 Tax=Variovorax sp. AFSI2.2 TaxID=3384160 RepID=UPI003EBE19AD